MDRLGQIILNHIEESLRAELEAQGNPYLEEQEIQIIIDSKVDDIIEKLVSLVI